MPFPQSIEICQRRLPIGSHRSLCPERLAACGMQFVTGAIDHRVELGLREPLALEPPRWLGRAATARTAFARAARRTSDRAEAWGRNSTVIPRASATAWTCPIATVDSLRRTRATVAVETPLRRANCGMVIRNSRRRSSSFSPVRGLFVRMRRLFVKS